MKYGSRTLTLCLEEGPPWWPPSSGECSLLVPLPVPARDPPAWKWPRSKAVAECHDSLVLQCAWPIKTHLAVVYTLTNSLLWEPVSQDWPLVYLELIARCPEAEDQQGTPARAALEPPKGVASLSAPLHFRVEETERSARWRPLRPGRVNRLISREMGTMWCCVHRSSPEGPALKSPGQLASGHFSRRLSSENDVRRSVFGPVAPLWCTI